MPLRIATSACGVGARLWLGLTRRQFAKKLGIVGTTIGGWERDGTPTDPLVQALLRILDRIPEPGLRARG